jgi:hypothetical protein
MTVPIQIDKNRAGAKIAEASKSEMFVNDILYVLRVFLLIDDG